MSENLVLHGYWRSSAAYRVRIALNLKGLDYEDRAVHLLNNGGEQHAADFHALNPQELIPVLQHAGHVIRQSLAIIEYVEETFAGPALLPSSASARAQVRALAQAIACDVHPLNNLRVLQYLQSEFDIAPSGRERWGRHWIGAGLTALEALLHDDPAAVPFCHGDVPGMADACLVPQIYNARRFDIDLTPFPTLVRINANCLALPAFDRARPENQPDAIPA